MLRLHMLMGLLASPVISLLTREREEPAPSSEPPLVETPERWEEFYRELSRARRHERTFAIARIPLDHVARGESPDASQTDDKSLGETDPREQIAARIRESVRLTDSVWVDGDNAFVLLPESDREEAAVAVPRAANGGVGVPPDEISVAVFPDDGVTSGAVLAALIRPDESDEVIPVRPDGEPDNVTTLADHREAG